MLLTLGIPTRNRVGYLRDLLAALELQVLEQGVSACDLEILVSDNASTDETLILGRQGGRLNQWSALGGAASWRNDENPGCPRQLPQASGGGGRPLSVDFRRRRSASSGRSRPDTSNPPGRPPGSASDSVREAVRGATSTGFPFRLVPGYIQACVLRVHPHCMRRLDRAHAHRTSHIYQRRTPSTTPSARRMEETDFLHMYGMAKGLKDRGGAIRVDSSSGR